MDEQQKVAMIAVSLVLSALIIIGNGSLPGITGMATVSNTPDKDYSFFLQSMKSIDTDRLMQDFENNKETISLIYSMADSASAVLSQDGPIRSFPPALAVAMLYHESAGFDTNAIRCEKSYESGGNGPYGKLVTSLDCAQYGCDKSVSQIECSYEGCDKNELDTYKSKFPAFHQVSCSYGLSQVMYPTAYDLGYRGSASDLLNPQTNIGLGIKYLQQQIQRYDGNIAFALAAYNAGPGNVNRCKNDDFETFINCLPNPQVTGKYISLIMTYSVIFEKLIKEEGLPKPEDVAALAAQRFAFTPPPLSMISSSKVDLNPNFKVLVPYVFSEYDELKASAQVLVSYCKGRYPLEPCIRERIDAFNREQQGRFIWNFGQGCEGGQDVSQEFQAFLEKVSDCAESLTNNCICEGTAGGEYLMEQVGSNVRITHGSESYIYQDLTLGISNLQLEEEDLLGLDNNGGLIKGDSSKRACVSGIDRTYRFCVKTSQKLPDYRSGNLDEDYVTYRFALSFNPGSEEPPVATQTILKDGLLEYTTSDIRTISGEVKT